MEYVPPYGSEGALYLRPLLFGTGARIGLQPSDEYTLLVMAIPVGNYYKVRLLVFLFSPPSLDTATSTRPSAMPPIFSCGSYAGERKNLCVGALCFSWKCCQVLWGGDISIFPRATHDVLDSPNAIMLAVFFFSVGRLQADDSGGDRGLRPGGPQGCRRRQGGRQLRGGHDAEHAGQAGRLPHRTVPGCQDEHARRGTFSLIWNFSSFVSSGLSRDRIFMRSAGVLCSNVRKARS